MAAAEYYSEHPLGRAVVAAGDFRPVPGRGVTAHVGEDVVDVGSPALLNERDHTSLRIVSELEESGHTAVVVRVNGVTVVALRLTDRLRHGAAEALAQITAVTGIRPLLLIGDNHLLLTGHNHRAASRLAAQVGIHDVRAGLLPQDMVTAVRALESDGATVMLVGDGVNDALAIAAAQVGVATGRAGSDLALDTADVVITRDDLGTLPAVIALACRARRVVIAATFIAVLVAWDLVGHLPLPDTKARPSSASTD